MDAARYVADNFGPVTEEITATDLPVTGSIPPELNGRYLRNGPNPVDDVDLATHHWFIGEGMVHGIRLGDGKADWYRNRWVRTEQIVAALSEDPAGRTFAGPNNTHVIAHANRTWALVEAGSLPVELDYTLDTVGANDFFGTLTDQGFTAHPKIDPDTGDLHAMCYHWPDWGDHIQYVVVGRDGRVKRTVDIPVPGMIMIHDMSLTEHYAVIYDLPVTISMDLLGKGMGFPFGWNDGYEPRVGLLPRDGAAEDIIWCPVNPCYVFHPMNAFEDDAGRVVIDVCRYERMFHADHNGPFGDSLATLDRWTIDPATRRVNEQRIDDRAQEFPRCHPALNSKPYRYGYSVGVGPGTFPAIHKHDLRSGTRSSIELGPGKHSAEPFFIPREGAASEDDGYLMTFVFDGERNASDLVIFDALDVAKPPLAEVHLPARVPYGFHGAWVPDDYDGPSV
ncbi:MAG: carotenoid oxygenase family protein [Gammaproteobacteria bacterium]|nr:carotenoid oxygenase family protein [Gammaproteobacteria bacterium]